MRALVTGARGFIGTHLTAALVESGWQVVAMCRRPVEPALKSVSVTTAHLDKPASLIRAMTEAGPVDAVFHLAARLPGADDTHETAAFLAENGVATATLLDAAMKAGCRHFVYASTVGVVGLPRVEPVPEDHPVSFRHAYFLGKYAGEAACALAPPGIYAVSLRISSPYGPGMAEASILPRWVGHALGGMSLEVWGEGTRAQDFVHVTDVVRGLLLAADLAQGGVYNVGGGTVTTMGELAHAVAGAVGGTVAVRAARRPDPQEGVRWHLDLSRSTAVLGYVPRMGLAQGLAEYVAWRRGEFSWRPWWKAAT